MRGKEEKENLDLSKMSTFMKKRETAKKLLEQYNLIGCVPKGKEIIKKLLGSISDNFYIEPPFSCDFGQNIEIGDYFCSNRNLLILDIAKVSIGKNVLIGPNVCIYSGGHPLHHKSREEGICVARSVTIGDHVWICGSVIINGGVHIGDYSVIGSGSVVTKNIPSGVFAAGNPCRVIREITEEDAL